MNHIFLSLLSKVYNYTTYKLFTQQINFTSIISILTLETNFLDIDPIYLFVKLIFVNVFSVVKIDKLFGRTF